MKEGGGGELEEVSGDEEVVPLAKFGPGFGFELGFGVGGDDSFGVGEGGDPPEDDPRNAGGFANTVAAGSGFLDGLGRSEEAVADAAEEGLLPVFRTCFMFEPRRFGPPREGTHNEGIGIVRH